MGLAMLIGTNPCHAESGNTGPNEQTLIGISSLFPLVNSSPSEVDRTTNDITVIDRLNTVSVYNTEDWQKITAANFQSHLVADRPTTESTEGAKPKETDGEPSYLEEPLDTENKSRSDLWRSGRPDGHAPIGVMGDHTHDASEVMFSYRFMRMDMAGNRYGTTGLSSTQVLEQFPVTPTEMTMDMHMLGVMYAPTDELTVSVMAPYIFKSMDHVTRMGVNFTTQADGFGDIRLMGLYKILDQDRQRLHLNAGISFPTGSTNQRDDTPAGPDQVLPYPMQLGSGTFDLLPGITYLGQSDHWSWGGQALGTIRLGTNGNS